MKRWILALAAVGTALATAAPLVAQEGPPLRTVEAYAEAFVSAVARWDVDAWAQLVTEDVVMMAPSGRTVEGREAFHELWTRTFEGRTGVNPLSVNVLEVRSEGDLAVVRAEYGPQGADPVGQYVWTLERDERGGWILAWWIFNRRTREGG